MLTVDTRLAGREEAWTFSGRSTWKEVDGVLHSPLFANPLFFQGDALPNYYADYALFDEHPEMRYKWEQAYPTLDFFTDIDASITLQQYYSAASGCEIIFRALDSVRCYAVQVIDMGRHGHDYKVALLATDASGYSSELAVAFAPHSVMADELIHGGLQNRADWERTSPEPVTLRVKTDGPRIAVFMDGAQLFTVMDDTYQYGATGISACVDAPVKISKYRLRAQPAEAVRESWRDADCTGFVQYPVPRHRVGGWYSNPLLHRTPAGEIIMSFSCTPEGPPTTWRDPEESPAFTYSTDDGQTWSDPRIITVREGCRFIGTMMGHTDGSWSFIGFETGKTTETMAERRPRPVWRTRSTDRGETWGDMEELEFGGKKAHEFGWKSFFLYSAPFRISDGTVLMTGYNSTCPEHAILTHENRRDQSFVLRSTDDGHTWSAPILIDTMEFDSNECMIAEPEPGKLVSFSRSLRARFEWTATSTDGGLTWSELRQSSESGDSPCLLTHSSGAIVMSSRLNSGNSVTISFDAGQTWTRKRRVTPCGMAAMVELRDGRVLMAGHTGWSNPTWIHTDTFRITADGPVADRRDR